MKKTATHDHDHDHARPPYVLYRGNVPSFHVNPVHYLH